MYETALNENDKLKSRLRDSKQELAKIRSQLDKVTQVPHFGDHYHLTELRTSGVLNSES
jgi:hypothetical protein